jgi:hypothetical protein
VQNSKFFVSKIEANKINGSGDAELRCKISAHARFWQLTIFGCTAEIGRNRANADLAPSSAANDL